MTSITLERERRRRAEDALASAKREAHLRERDAQRYSAAFHRALADVARLQTQIAELGALVDESRRNGRIAAILSGVAVIASVATYLARDEQDSAEPSDEAPKASKPSQAKRGTTGTRTDTDQARRS